MRHNLLFTLLFTLALNAFSTTWTITNSGSTFSPSTLTISAGDTVKFVLSTNHNVVEVSQATWNGNGNTALPGFSLPFGGGFIYPAQLTAGTHYYVCTPHAMAGMKGTIIVQSTSGILEDNAYSAFSIYPNPCSGKFQIEKSNTNAHEWNFELYNFIGETINTSITVNRNKTEVDISNCQAGVYFVRIKDQNNIYIRKIILRN